jgi:hypothetical protein
MDSKLFCDPEEPEGFAGETGMDAGLAKKGGGICQY